MLVKLDRLLTLLKSVLNGQRTLIQALKFEISRENIKEAKLQDIGLIRDFLKMMPIAQEVIPGIDKWN